VNICKRWRAVRGPRRGRGKPGKSRRRKTVEELADKKEIEKRLLPVKRRDHRLNGSPESREQTVTNREKEIEAPKTSEGTSGPRRLKGTPPQSIPCLSPTAPQRRETQSDHRCKRGKKDENEEALYWTPLKPALLAQKRGSKKRRSKSPQRTWSRRTCVVPKDRRNPGKKESTLPKTFLDPGLTPRNPTSLRKGVQKKKPPLGGDPTIENWTEALKRPPGPVRK